MNKIITAFSISILCSQASLADTNCYWLPDRKLDYVDKDNYQPTCAEPFAISILIRAGGSRLIPNDRKRGEANIIYSLEEALRTLKTCGVATKCEYSGGSSDPTTYRIQIIVPKARPLSDNEIDALRGLTK